MSALRALRRAVAPPNLHRMATRDATRYPARGNRKRTLGRAGEASSKPSRTSHTGEARRCSWTCL
jgi:hypothetical protein